MFDFITTPRAKTTFASGDVYKRATGLLAGTRVATAQGWCDVARVREGDRVLTFDGGLQRVTRVVRHRLSVGEAARDPAHWPVFVPEGAMGNLSDMMLLPGQPVLIESDVAEEMYGDPFVAVRGGDLHGVDGIARMAPADDAEVITLHFETDQVVFVAGGVLALCEGTGCLLNWVEKSGPAYRVLSQDDAETVLLYCVAPAGSAAGQCARAA